MEYDLAKANNEDEKAEELAEQLFVVQKLNSEKLKDIITEYQPQHVSRVWGGYFSSVFIYYLLFLT